MANVSQQFMDDMGPLSALWTGRDQGLQENTSLVNQQVGLENIANSQQTRDIQKQKLPFELDQLQHQKQMNPLLIQEKETKIKGDKVKLDKDQFDNFFGEFKMVIPTLQGTPADGALLGEVAKKHGMDPADPRIRRMIDTAASGNAKAVNDMLQKIALMDAKSIQERAKQGDVDAAHMSRTEKEIAGRRDVAGVQAAASLERARIAAQAKAKASGTMHELLKITKGDPVKTKTALIQMGNEALRAGKTDEAEALFQQANDPSLSALAANAQAQRPQLTITPEGGIAPSGGVQPVPPAGGRQPPQGNPQSPQGVPPIGKIKIGNTEYELLENLPDGTKRIRDPATGRTGTVK